MKIAIVENKIDFAISVAEDLAKTLNLKIIDIEKKLNKLLIGMNFPIVVENEIYHGFEKSVIFESLKLNDCIILVPEDAFFSNKNYKQFEDVAIILINSKKDEKNNINLIKLINNYKTIKLNKENYNLNDIIKKIRGYYDW